MAEKVRGWWSEDGKWFCILANDGVSQATVSLTREEAKALASEIYDPARPPDNDLCDCGAMTATGDWHGIHSPACKALDL